jgi:hypothetical protein
MREGYRDWLFANRTLPRSTPNSRTRHAVNPSMEARAPRPAVHGPERKHWCCAKGLGFNCKAKP